MAAAVLAALAGPVLRAQNVPVPLNYNFNGIVHAGESALPDDPNGYRSISDRGLDFSAGVPNDPLVNPYQLVAMPGVLDIVHLGNRNTVNGGAFFFDAVPDGDDVGIQPTWLANPDQSGPQTTVLATPLAVTNTTSVAFLYQISNGGGSFDVTVDFFGGASTTATLSGGDWFGGVFLGTQNVDSGISGNNLSIVEGRVDLSAFAGQVVQQITFSNPSNTNAGYAILACNFEYPPEPSLVNRIPLNYNWNGIAHAGETGVPDDPVGFRAISDRALDFTAGVPQNPILDGYAIVDQPLALDCVHLGNRNVVNGGAFVFDATPDGDDVGIQPLWLPNPDQTGPQLTTLAQPILMDASSAASLLFQISNGGGTFEVEFQFQAGLPVVATVSGPDWFGGTFAGTANVDSALPNQNLEVTERTIDLSAEAGRVLTGVAFQNASNSNAGHAIYAMNVIGCLQCTNGVPAVITNLGGGTGATISTPSTGNLGCDLVYEIAGAQPNALGAWAVGAGVTTAPLSLVLPGCPGTIYTPNPILLTGVADGAGGASLTIPVPPVQGLCGFAATAQFAELAPGACFLVLSDALSITIGN